MITILGDEKIMEVTTDTSYDAVYGYSRVKEWEVENMEYSSPIDAIGKAPLGGGVYTDSIFIVQNGWKIRPAGYPANSLITIKGTLITDDNSSPVTPAVEGEPVNWLIQATTSATVITVNSGSGISQEEHDKLMAIPTADENKEGLLKKKEFLALK